MQERTFPLGVCAFPSGQSHLTGWLKSSPPGWGSGIGLLDILSLKEVLS